MKEGKTINELAQIITAQEESKRDFIADTRKLYMRPTDNKIEMAVGAETELFDLQPIAHRQISAWSDIPQKYYDRMPPDLRAVNVNHWLKTQVDKKGDSEKRMVRTLDGKVRAFMSDRYRVLDNFDLMQSVLPVLMEVPEMTIASAEITENRMYLKALFPRIQGEISVGDAVQSGVVISNSEVGQGSLRIEPLVFRLVCANGMISPIAHRRYHVGRRSGADDAAFEVFSDATLQADDRAYWMKVADTVRASLDQSVFDNTLIKMRKTIGMKITDDPVEVVERAKRQFTLTDGERGGILNHLVDGGDLSAYGLLNAITRHSQDVEDYDRATELERIGGKIIELDQRSWRHIAEAA